MGSNNLLIKKILRYLVVGSMTFLLFLEENAFGKNDVWSFGFIIISTFVMYATIFRLQKLNREVFRVNTKKGSFLYKFFTGAGWLSYIISFIISFISSFSITVVLKGMVITHGIIPVIMAIFIGGLIIFLLINDEKIIMNRTVQDNMAEDISSNINTFYYLILVSVVFNLIVTLFLSAHDVSLFIDNSITIDNFDEKVIEHKILKNGSNDISRIFIHIYMLMENIKMAVTNIIFEKILEVNKADWFFISYIIIVFLNFIKMMGFSFGFIFLLKGLEEILKTIIFLVQKTLRKTNV